MLLLVYVPSLAAAAFGDTQPIVNFKTLVLANFMRRIPATVSRMFWVVLPPEFRAHLCVQLVRCFKLRSRTRLFASLGTICCCREIPPFQRGF